MRVTDWGLLSPKRAQFIRYSRAEEGFALLAVAIVLAALSLMMAVVVQAARESVHDADSRVTAVRTAAALEGALATAARDLSQHAISGASLLSQPQTTTLNGVTVTASVRPEAAKVDLNVAEPDLLAALLQVHGVARTAAQIYVEEILDWRDDDTIARPSGAEAAEYLAVGRSYVPSNRGFSSISELRLLLHGSRDLAACLTPDLTVYSGQAGIDLASASSTVLASAKLVGMVPPAKSVMQVSLATGHVIESGAVFEINFVAKDDLSGRSTSRQYIVRVTGSTSQPIWILAHTLIPREEEAKAACAKLAEVS